MSTYVGLWHGGSSYSLPEWNDAETFPSIKAAGEALSERYDSGRHVRFDYITRGTEHTDTPVVEIGSTLTLYVWGRNDSLADLRRVIETEGAAMADAILEIGPRGGVRRA